MQHPDPISDLLRKWPHTPHASDAFQSQVWDRIASAPTSTSTLAFLTSARAAACWAILLASVAGSGAAYTYDSFTRNERMATAHAQRIDPIQLTAHRGPHVH